MSSFVNVFRLVVGIVPCATMLMMIRDRTLDGVGNTPLVRLVAKELEDVNAFAKAEYMNPTGSVKDRPAKHIIDSLLASGRIDRETLIVESSSGNFGIALAAATSRRGMRFRCIIDPRINAANEMLMRSLGVDVVKVTELDHAGGYLLARIKAARETVATVPNSYWVNQYGNPLNAEAYAVTLAEELRDQLPTIDYAFVGVSSGGTITGVSQRLKEIYPNVRVVAVDTVGSVIFGGAPCPRWIPGIGASVVPDIIKEARIDDVVMIDEATSVRSCHELWREQHFLVGGSSGTAFAAMRRYFAGKSFKVPPVAVAIFADRGDRYADTIFNAAWCDKLFDGTLRRSVRPPPPPPAPPRAEG